MTEKLKDAIENEQIAQLDVIELIETYQNLVYLGVLEPKSFDDLLNSLGIDRVNTNKFVMDENTVYEL